MFRKTLYISLSAAIATVALNFFAVHYHLYWRIWWYDIPIHFLGGMVLGGLGIWFLFSLKQSVFSWLSGRRMFALVIIFTFCAGTTWEIFEYSLGDTLNTIGSYPLDTIKDLVMDLLGTYLVWRVHVVLYPASLSK